MSVTRYLIDSRGDMMEHRKGFWVEYSEYKKLQGESKEWRLEAGARSGENYLLKEENKKLLTQWDELLSAAKDLCIKSLGYLNSEDEILVRLETAIKNATEEKK